MTNDEAAPCDPTMIRWLRSLVPRSRHRAGRARIAHDLAADHAERLFREQRGCCAISGLPFSLVAFQEVLVKHPFAPSLDRISSRGGYTTDNVRLVCIAVNFGMGQWGQELYLTFARAAVDRSDQSSRPASEVAEPEARVAEPESGNVPRKVVSWTIEQRERLAAAEAIAAVLSDDQLAKQRRHIASLKRALTLGPSGLTAAAVKAARSRRI